VLRRLIEPKMEEGWGWRKLNNEELHNFNALPNAVTDINLRRTKWRGYQKMLQKN
jgi:hypothetical protein